jgi:hypothetical protein
MRSVWTQGRTMQHTGFVTRPREGDGLDRRRGMRNMLIDQLEYNLRYQKCIASWPIIYRLVATAKRSEKPMLSPWSEV